MTDEILFILDYAQQVLAPDAAPLRFAAQVKRIPLARPCRQY